LGNNREGILSANSLTSAIHAKLYLALGVKRHPELEPEPFSQKGEKGEKYQHL
jgi:hypothetical protein